MKLTNLNLKNLDFKIFLAFLTICPVFYDTTKILKAAALRTHQEQFFQLGVVVLFALVFLENVYLSLFLLWSVAIYVYYEFPAIGGAYVMNIFWAVLLYQIAYKLIDENRIKTLFKAVLWLCVANIVSVSFQLIGWEMIFMRAGKYTTDLVGFMGLKCFMGMLFALAMPIFAYFNWKLSPLFFIPIYLSESSVAVVGGIAGLLFTLWFKNKKAFIGLIAICTVAGTLFVARDTKTGMFEGRFRMWKVVMQDAFKHPFIGWGLDSFRNVGAFKPFLYIQNGMTLETRRIDIKTLAVMQETGVFPPGKDVDFVREGDALDVWDNPHNEYIMLFYEFGLMGVLIIGALFMDIVKKFTPSPELIAIMGVFIVFLIISTGQFPFHVVRLGYLAPVMLGAYYKLKDKEIGDVIYGS